MALWPYVLSKQMQGLLYPSQIELLGCGGVDVGRGAIHGRRKQDCFCSNLLRWGKGRESEDGDFREGNLTPVYFLLCAPADLST